MLPKLNKKNVKDEFYTRLQQEIDETEENTKIISDLSKRVEKNNSELEDIMGKKEESANNNNGQKIIELCIENDLVMTNIKFKHKDIHKYTRKINSKDEKLIIDYFLVSREKFNQVREVKISEEQKLESKNRTKNAKNKQKRYLKKQNKLKKKIKTYNFREKDRIVTYQNLVDNNLRKFKKKTG